jgi:hypothetical protein
VDADFVPAACAVVEVAAAAALVGRRRATPGKPSATAGEECSWEEKAQNGFTITLIASRSFIAR